MYGKGCGCPECVDWDRQCKHELCGNRFVIEKNSSRLFNDFLFQEKKLYGDRKLEELTTTGDVPMTESTEEDQPVTNLPRSVDQTKVVDLSMDSADEADEGTGQ